MDEGYITHRELSAHIRRIDDNLAALREDVDEIRVSVGAGQRWLSARVTVLLDRALPVVLAAAATFLMVRM